MNPILLLLPWFVVGALALYALTRAVGAIWIKYRVHMAVLKRLEHDPDLLASPKRLEAALSEASARHRLHSRQDYVITGLVLALIGLAFIAVGLELGSGIFAAGSYVGGFVCAVLGSVVALLTLFFRWMTRPRIYDYAHKPSAPHDDDVHR